jgi:hypothetical protein
VASGDRLTDLNEDIARCLTERGSTILDSDLEGLPCVHKLQYSSFSNVGANFAGSGATDAIQFHNKIQVVAGPLVHKFTEAIGFRVDTQVLTHGFRMRTSSGMEFLLTRFYSPSLVADDASASPSKRKRDDECPERVWRPTAFRLGPPGPSISTNIEPAAADWQLEVRLMCEDGTGSDPLVARKLERQLKETMRILSVGVPFIIQDRNRDVEAHRKSVYADFAKHIRVRSFPCVLCSFVPSFVPAYLPFSPFFILWRASLPLPYLHILLSLLSFLPSFRPSRFQPPSGRAAAALNRASRRYPPPPISRSLHPITTFPRTSISFDIIISL